VADVFPFLQHVDVFVFPTLGECSGSLLLEALQAGVAVVASRVDGIPEDVSDGDSGLLVEPGSPESLATALGRLVTGPDLRRCLAASARRTFVARFVGEPLARALAGLYGEFGLTARVP
jgi:glycosyltransferase involved in cell wall biosynthesis